MSKLTFLKYSHLNEKLYYDMVIMGIAEKLCRDKIRYSYIKECFCDINNIGFIVKLEDEYVGFILFNEYNKKYDDIYLSLIATKENLNMNIGKKLLHMYEEYAYKNKIKYLVADAVNSSIGFYKKYNWKIIEKYDETLFIEKKLIYKKEKISLLSYISCFFYHYITKISYYLI